MKQLWGRKASPAAPSRQFVTHDELPGLVRRVLLELLTQKVIIEQPVESIGDLAQRGRRKVAGALAPFVRPTKTKRAPGHTHRGRCGPRCFTGERGPQ